MDIRHYFNPVDFTQHYEKGRLTWKQSLGSQIENGTQSFDPDSNWKPDLVLLGATYNSDEKEGSCTTAPDNVRERLYQLSRLSSKLRIVDLGNIIPSESLKANYKALRDIVDYLHELSIVVVVIGGSQDLSIGIAEAFKSLDYFSYTAVDPYPDVKKRNEPLDATNYLSRIFSSQPSLFQFNLLAFQRHLVSAGQLNRLKGVNVNLSLGALREDIFQAEPVLRNSDVLSFDLGAIKGADAPGTLRNNPNGLRSEEACQLARLAGLSNRLKVAGFFGLQSDEEIRGLTASLTAEMVWYLMEGIADRANDYPGGETEEQLYKVEVEDMDEPLVFVQNKITGRWWMKLKLINGEQLYVGCSKKEYDEASKNEIPGLWLKYIQKSDQLLK